MELWKTQPAYDFNRETQSNIILWSVENYSFNKYYDDEDKKENFALSFFTKADLNIRDIKFKEKITEDFRVGVPESFRPLFLLMHLYTGSIPNI